MKIFEFSAANLLFKILWTNWYCKMTSLGIRKAPKNLHPDKKRNNKSDGQRIDQQNVKLTKLPTHLIEGALLPVQGGQAGAADRVTAS